MQKMVLLLGVSVVIGSASGCAINKRQLLTIQLIAARNEIADVLSKIRDGDSARAWKLKIKQLTDREKEAKDGLQKEDKLNKDEAAVMEKDFGDDIEHVNTRYGAELARVQLDSASWDVIREHFSGLNPSKKDFNMEPIQRREPGQQGGPPKDMPGPPGGGMRRK